MEGTFWYVLLPLSLSQIFGGAILGPSWYDLKENVLLPFFCYRAIVVREKKTWEEALDHCRKHHRDLASVASDTEMLLIQGELRKSCTTERVWIGLHFLPDRWLWVDRQPLGYRAWGSKETEACPAGRCAAIQLPMGKTQRGEAFSNCSNVPPNPEPLANWVPLNCRERLHFICD
uniref:C-type lectin domain-containing protein n=1 Tax=Salarias fasciatus TaxID=181472 RepID=A0A672GBX2_SALFA